MLLTAYLLLTLLLVSASARSEPQPLAHWTATGPFLNRMLPEAAPPPPYDVIPAFPRLLFTNAVGLGPVPGTSNLLCVWEREGRVWTFPNAAETSRKRLLLDIRPTCQGWDDSGLLGLAFHPGFKTNHFLFLYYAWVPPGKVLGSAAQRPPSSMSNRFRLSRFTLDANNVALPGSESVFIDQQAPSIWHMGGALLFNPADGFLYLGIGDNNERTNTQRIDLSLFSGILRIDVDRQGGNISHPIPRQPRLGTTTNYFIPNSNPFVGRPGVLEEFFALGLRNPYRMSCDPVSGCLFVSDVGEQLREEVNRLDAADPPGMNFQWPIIEGMDGNLTPPYLGINKSPWLDYTHVEGQAVIGGYVYRGQAFGRSWEADTSLAIMCREKSGRSMNRPPRHSNGFSAPSATAGGPARDQTTWAYPPSAWIRTTNCTSAR